MRNKAKMKNLLSVILLFFATLATAEPQKSWPAISPLSANYQFNESNPHLKITLLSTDGDPLYNLECHQGNMDKTYKESGDFEGFFQCKLAPLYERKFDLFVPEGDWHGIFTRATFRTGWGDKCESHAFYGLKRTFDLRGFSLTLGMSPIRFSPSNYDMVKKSLDKPDTFEFSFSITARPKAEAHNASALKVPEVCEVGFKINEKQQLEELIQYYPEGE